MSRPSRSARIPLFIAVSLFASLVGWADTTPAARQGPGSAARPRHDAQGRQPQEVRQRHGLGHRSPRPLTHHHSRFRNRPASGDQLSMSGSRRTRRRSRTRSANLGRLPTVGGDRLSRSIRTPVPAAPRAGISGPASTRCSRTPAAGSSTTSWPGPSIASAAHSSISCAPFKIAKPSSVCTMRPAIRTVWRGADPQAGRAGGAPGQACPRCSQRKPA
jgi:hypothetical protein